MLELVKKLLNCAIIITIVVTIMIGITVPSAFAETYVFKNLEDVSIDIPSSFEIWDDDLIELGYFAEAVRDKKQTPIDVYESVLMSCVVALSGDSIAKGGQPVEVPDFTRGKWKTRKPTFAI